MQNYIKLYRKFQEMIFPSKTTQFSTQKIRNNRRNLHSSYTQIIFTSSKAKNSLRKQQSNS